MIFSAFHPATVIIYYVTLCTLLVATKHPIILLITLCAFIYQFLLLHIESMFRKIVYYGFVLLLVIIVSLAFKHNGVTPLCFWNDQAVTKEVFIWALYIGLLMMALSFIYEHITINLPIDRLLYVLRLIWPTLGMSVMLFIRFGPEWKMRFHHIHQTQKTIGYYATASIFDRYMGILKMWCIAFVWTLDQCLAKWEMMKQRGFQLSSKKTFSVYSFLIKDILVIIFLLISNILFYIYSQHISYYYFPMMKPLHLSTIWLVLIFLITWAPNLILWKELIKWRYYNSKM